MTLTKQSATTAGRSKAAKARKSLTPDQLFFYEHAGFSWKPGKETREQGRIRCAISMAQAEQYGQNVGFTFEWEEDWSIGSHKDFYGEGSYSDSEPKTCESCLCRGADGQVLASVGCVDDASYDYRRVIEAELASEALVAYDRETETLDAH